jgi:hypothetical protein
MYVYMNECTYVWTWKSQAQDMIQPIYKEKMVTRKFHQKKNTVWGKNRKIVTWKFPTSPLESSREPVLLTKVPHKFPTSSSPLLPNADRVIQKMSSRLEIRFHAFRHLVTKKNTLGYDISKTAIRHREHGPEMIFQNDTTSKARQKRLLLFCRWCVAR